MVIKPSGLVYEAMQPEHMVVVDLGGKVIEGHLKPSSDTPTHLELYNNFADIAAVAHTHSRCVTVFAKRRQPITPYGTTHADHFHGPVPCTRPLTDAEIQGDYEMNTGKVIIELGHDHQGIPASLVANHGPFVWGPDPMAAARNAAAIE
jgi:L-ribulose-5-phosphate 4-epimerase